MTEGSGALEGCQYALGAGLSRSRRGRRRARSGAGAQDRRA
ncbi:hypothetical protein C4K40_4867 [Pseudomonas sp. CMR5c]|nr:hypothetical protein C4K40_4867 [Pseudomonas sp. CMR5c]